MAETPANLTADRLDRVVAGQFIHLDPFTLSDAPPEDGWLEVADVLAGGESTLVTFVDDQLFTGPSGRLVRIGWA